MTCRPVLAELATAGSPFVGTLFAGLMLTPTGRGCSSTTAGSAIPRRSRCCRCSTATSSRRSPPPPPAILAGVDARPRSGGAAVTVVLAAGDYPARGDRGSPIDGIDAAEATGALVFHAGTALRDGRLVTNGGRILSVTATGDDARRARATGLRRRRPDPDSPGRGAARTSRSGRRAAGRGNAASERASVGAPQPTTHCQFYRQEWQQTCRSCANSVPTLAPARPTGGDRRRV